MNIVNVTDGDTGHQSYLLSKAINEHTPHCSLSCTRKQYFDWPHDVLWREEWRGRVPEWIRAFWARADVLHIHKYRRTSYWASYPDTAGVVIHQHGRHPNNQDDLLALDARRGAVRVVSTLNLLEAVDWDIERWFPRPIDLLPPREVRRSGTVRVIHCPTVRARKQTAELLEVVGSLQQAGHDIEVEVVEGVSHLECMVRKARADILFDQLNPSYGTNALEAWAMGIPAVVGMSDRLHEFVERAFGYAPYVRACAAEELYAALERLIVDVDYRAGMGRVGREYVAEWHAPKRAAEIAVRTYRHAIEVQKERREEQ